jgi:hypothetical protein
MKNSTFKKTHSDTVTPYIIRLGNSQAEVVVPHGFPSPDPGQPLEVWIGRQTKRGKLPPATITIGAQTYPAKLIRDHSLDEN